MKMAEVGPPPLLVIRGALVDQVLMLLPIVPPRLSPRMTGSDDRTRGSIPGNGAGCCTLSLRVFIRVLPARVRKTA